MLSFSFLLLTVAFSGAFCDDLFGMKLTTERVKAKEDTQYLFRYYVKDDVTGDYKSQEETREGDSVHGSYTIAEPNGDLRTVTYTAGPGRGFEATVDVKPSGSPTKQVLDTATISDATPLPLKRNIKTSEPAKTERATTLESNVKRFPGGFIMDILSKPQSEMKTEMGMKFSMKPSDLTEAVTESTITDTTATVIEKKTTQRSKTTLAEEETIPTTITAENLQESETENSTIPTEGRETTEDPVEKEINEIINSMPKLPELVLSDNKTRLKFHQDPEEALIDERITQIARQLAETSLRREYEERKLGHFIPISVRPIERSNLNHLSKSIKLTGNDIPDIRSSEATPHHVLTHVRLVPQYIYNETLIPKFSPVHQRLPVLNRPIMTTLNFEEPSYEMVTDVAETSKNVKPNNEIKEVIGIAKIEDTNDTTQREPISVVPIQVPAFLQFFSPRYVMHTQRSFVTESKPEILVSPLSEDLTIGKRLHDFLRSCIYNKQLC